MNSAFKEMLPSALVSNTLALCGNIGERWLRDLPRIIHSLEEDWSITVEQPFVNGKYNYVASAILRGGTPTLLKIASSRDDLDNYSEAKFLRTLNGTGVVMLLREDRGLRAMLLERAVPGQTVTRIFDNDESSAVPVAIELLKRLHREPPPELSAIILLDDWFDNLRRCQATDFPAHYAVKALSLYEQLSGQSERIGYLHGDFHPDNIVSAARAPFLAIDPKGIVGHIGYEIAVFLNNFHWWQEGKRDIRQRLDVAVRQFSHAFDIDPYELRQWAFAQMVLSAWWMFDEMSEIYANEVVKADIWDV